MKNKELQERLNDIKSKLRLFDDIVDVTSALINKVDEDEPDSVSLNLRQANAVQELLDLFRELNWELALSNHKNIEYGDGEAIRSKTITGKTGDPVRIRPVGDEYEDKTYFGILVGDVSRQIRCSVKDETLNVDYGMYNPAILVPELGRIVYGSESWWSTITNEDEMNSVITEETINNVWYVKALKEMVNDK